MLSFALVISAYVGWIPADRETATQLARRAAELDDDDPWAHVAIGYLAFTARKTDEALHHFRTALDLNPNFAAAYGAVGWALVFDGQSEEAIRCFENAVRMNPHDPLISFIFAGFSAAHYFAGRYSESIKWGRQAVQLRPGLLGGHRMLCAALAQAGQIEEAQSALKILRQLQPNLSIAWVTASVPYTPLPMAQFLEGLKKSGLTE
jgi:adenylate cyclase